ERAIEERIELRRRGGRHVADRAQQRLARAILVTGKLHRTDFDARQLRGPSRIRRRAAARVREAEQTHVRIVVRRLPQDPSLHRSTSAMTRAFTSTCAPRSMSVCGPAPRWMTNRARVASLQSA